MLHESGVCGIDDKEQASGLVQAKKRPWPSIEGWANRCVCFSVKCLVCLRRGFLLYLQFSEWMLSLGVHCAPTLGG